MADGQSLLADEHAAGKEPNISYQELETQTELKDDNSTTAGCVNRQLNLLTGIVH